MKSKPPILFPPFPVQHLEGSGSMSVDAFTASLERSKARDPPSKTSRITALMPQIEAALTQGSPLAHIVTALLTVGLAVTPHRLSKVVASLRRQRADAAGLPKARPALKANAGLSVGTDSPPGLSPVTRVSCVPTPALSPSTAPAARPPSQYGMYDPRLLDEIMRSSPDMKALAKQAPKEIP
jgi:hypothetical protein